MTRFKLYQLKWKISYDIINLWSEMLGRIVRPTLKSFSALSKMPLSMASSRLGRGFASGPTSSDVEKAEKKLTKILTSEIEYEEDNYAEDQSIRQYLQSNKWVLEDKPDSNLLVLKKVSGNSVIQIYFTSKSPNYEDEQDDQEKEPQEEKQEGFDHGNGEFTDFNIYVTQGKKTMALECTTVGGEIEVNSCNVVDDINVHRMMTPFGMAAVESYKGPEFGTLDESLQDAVFQLLKSHGVNPELADLIEHLALDKEQRLYMSWLKQVKNFITQN